MQKSCQTGYYLRVLPLLRDEELPPEREPEDMVPDERDTLLGERMVLEEERMVLLDAERTELADERDGVAERFAFSNVHFLQKLQTKKSSYPSFFVYGWT